MAQVRDRAGPFGLPSTVGVGGLLAAGLLLLLPLVFLPIVDQPVLVPKIALLAVALGPGLVLLVDLAVRGDTAARLGLAFVGVAGLSAALSGHPRMAWLGGFAVDRGALVLAAYVGCWAIGRRLHPDARPLLAVAAVASLGLNVVLGVVQVHAGGDLGFLTPVDGRASGLTPSSVYLGGLCAGGLLLGARVAATAASRRRLAPALAVVVLAAAGAELTGSRASTILGSLGVAAVLVVIRPRWRTVGAVVLAVALGFAGGVAAGAGASSTQRLDAGGASGLAPRATMWGAALEATAERPVLGWGPGRFRAATSPRTTAAFARAEGPDRIYFDAHNLAVELLTTTGGLGLLLAGGFVVVAARRARGPLAWLALGIGATWLLEPMSMVTAPVALLALGAAWGPRGPPPVAVPDPPSRPVVAATGLAGALGAVVAAALVWGGVQVQTAIDHGDEAAIDRAEQVYRDDPTLSDLRGEILLEAVAATHSAEVTAARLEASRRTVALDPERPDWWVTLGVDELFLGDPDRARVAFDAALERNPWSARGLAGLAAWAELEGDAELEASARARLCEVAPSACPPG